MAVQWGPANKLFQYLGHGEKDNHLTNKNMYNSNEQSFEWISLKWNHESLEQYMIFSAKHIIVL